MSMIWLVEEKLLRYHLLRCKIVELSSYLIFKVLNGKIAALSVLFVHRELTKSLYLEKNSTCCFIDMILQWKHEVSIQAKWASTGGIFMNGGRAGLCFHALALTKCKMETAGGRMKR